MNCYLCMLVPSLLSICLYEKLTNKKYERKEYIIYYLFFLLFNNLLSVIVCRILFGLTASLEMFLTNFPIFAVKYVIVSLMFAVFLPIFYIYLRKNIEINFEIKKGDKHEIKKKKKTRKKSK